MPLENTTQTAVAPAASSAQVTSAPAVESADLSQMFSAAQSAGDQVASSQVTAPTPQVSQASPQVATGSPQVSALAAQAAQLGIELPATATDADVATALMGRYQQMAPMAQYAQSLLPHADAINEFFATRGQAPAAPAAAQPPPEWSVDGHFQKHWDGPKLTAEMQFAMNQGMVVRDPETGLMIPKPGMEMMVAPILQGLNHALNWRTEAARGFIEDPYRKTYDVLRDPIQRMIDERVQQHLQAVQNQQRAVMSQQTAADGVNQFEAANESWIYQAANNGGKLLTPKGQQFVRLVKELSGSFTGTADVLLNVCKLAVHAQDQAGATASLAQAVTQQPAPVPAGATAAQASQQQKASFLQNALANAAHQPSGGANFVQSPTGPAVVSPMELESMFLNDFRAASAAA